MEFNQEIQYDDTLSWINTHDDDLWIFDKLILSKKLGYTCGPHGVDVPEPGEYIVRPCVNLMGMGRGARFITIEKSTDDILEAGEFWCEVFTGRHLSVDYTDKQQVLCVEGIQNKDDPLWKWDRWSKKDDVIPYPEILEELKGVYRFINIEMIGSKIIEIHLRHNPNWRDYTGDDMIPVFSPEFEIPEGYQYVDDPDHHRLGFLRKSG